MTIRCCKCGDVITGDKKGTYITCKCKTIAIDETPDYWRIIGNKEDFEEVKEKEEMKTNGKVVIDTEVNVDNEKLQETADILKEVNDSKPNITIRNNENVYVTINNFNETAKKYYDN